MNAVIICTPCKVQYFAHGLLLDLLFMYCGLFVVTSETAPHWKGWVSEVEVVATLEVEDVVFKEVNTSIITCFKWYI